MKIICDCENELEFLEDEKIKDEFGATYARDVGEFDLAAEHDRLWIECMKCKKSLFIFT